MGRWPCVERLVSEVTYDQKPIEELCGKRRPLKIVPGNSVLYVRLNTKGSHISETLERAKRNSSWMWITVGIRQANSVALSQIATHIPGDAKAESRVTLIRRWLMNFQVDSWAFYRAILEQVLCGRQAVTVYTLWMH